MTGIFSSIRDSEPLYSPQVVAKKLKTQTNNLNKQTQ